MIMMRVCATEEVTSRLTPRQRAILNALPATGEQLALAIHGDSEVGKEDNYRNLRDQVRRLRRLLENEQKTIWGGSRGYHQAEYRLVWFKKD